MFGQMFCSIFSYDCKVGGAMVDEWVGRERVNSSVGGVMLVEIGE